MFVPLNMDFGEAVTVDSASANWLPSPKKGVYRCPLERQQAEEGHATSLVRYEPGSRFSPHTHPGGEEILVLEGTFSDENGDYKAGTYLRNPLAPAMRLSASKVASCWLNSISFARATAGVLPSIPGHGAASRGCRWSCRCTVLVVNTPL